MIKLKSLLLEKEKTDVKFRKEAETLAKKIEKFLKKSPEKMDEIESNGGYILLGADVDSKYKSLIFRILPSNKGFEFGYGHPKGQYAKMFDVIDLPILIEPRNLKYIDTRFHGAMGKFVHEFIHYLDEKRYKADIRATGAQQMRLGDVSGYINNPAEFNAYYQEGAHEVWQSAKNIKNKDLKVKNAFFPKNINDFVKSKLTVFWPAGYLNNMDKKYSQKFKKRLSDLYPKILNFVYGVKK
jgi:hypothetical protein